MADMTVAKTILEQLGGNKFIVMTGAKNFICDDNSLRMTIGRNASRANRLKVILEPTDTYRMIFSRFTAGKFNKKTFTFTDDKEEIIHDEDGLYFDMLQPTFTEVTGMYTRL